MKYATLLALLFSYVFSSAQIPVDQEPHHKVILDNVYMRVLEGHIAPHDSTSAHIHAANSLVIFLSASTFSLETPGSAPVTSTVKSGDIKYVAYGDKPVTHIVRNLGDTEFHFLVVEIKRPLR
jgi:hypothetical protein